MRISDWSSDVCSSDLLTGRANSTMSRSGPEIGRTKPSRKMLWRRIGQLRTSPIFYSGQDPLIAPSRFASKCLIPNGIEYGSPPCVRHCEPAKRVKQSRAVWHGSGLPRGFAARNDERRRDGFLSTQVGIGPLDAVEQNGRASCRGGVCKYV